MAAARALTPLLPPANPSPLPLGSGREGRGEEEEEAAPRARAPPGAAPTPGSPEPLHKGYRPACCWGGGS